jgi:hypothetical protein
MALGFRALYLWAILLYGAAWLTLLHGIRLGRSAY